MENLNITYNRFKQANTSDNQHIIDLNVLIDCGRYSPRELINNFKFNSTSTDANLQNSLLKLLNYYRNSYKN